MALSVHKRFSGPFPEKTNNYTTVRFQALESP